MACHQIRVFRKSIRRLSKLKINSIDLSSENTSVCVLTVFDLIKILANIYSIFLSNWIKFVL
jgi:hypothetical protein